MIIIKINMVMIFTSIWAKNYAEGRIKMIVKDKIKIPTQQIYARPREESGGG